MSQREKPDRRRAAATVGMVIAGGVLLALYKKLPDILGVTNTTVDRNSLPKTIRKRFVLSDEDLDTYTLDVPRETYLGFRNVPRTAWSQSNLRSYQAQHGLVDDLARRILESPEENFTHFGSREKIPDWERITRFVMRNLDYQSDEGDGYAKHPLETLVEGGGDCEDLAITTASLLRLTGRSVGVLFEPKHATLAVGLRPGENPPSVSQLRMKPITQETIDRIQRETGEKKVTIGDILNGPYRHLLFEEEKRETAATLEHNGITYFAIETTSKDRFGVKKTLKDGWKFIPIF